MNQSLPTASSLERAIACPASVALPQIFSGGIDAERGSAIGKFARDVLAREPFEVALERVPRKDWRATCEALDWDALVGGLVNVRAEVAYGIVPGNDEARELGLNLGRRYPTLLVDEFCGTNDLEGQEDGLEVVGDIKSGQEVTACAVNPQMKFHALARHRRTGAKVVEGRLLYVRSDGRVTRDCHRFTAYELDVFDDMLRELIGRIARARAARAEGTIEVSETRQCHFCPAYSACPSKVALARAMLGDLRTAASDAMPMTPEEAGAAWLMALEAEQLAKRVRKSLNGYARQEPLRTRPGKMVRETQSHTTQFAEGEALALLRTLGATQAQLDDLFVETLTHPVREVNEASQARR